MSSPLCHFELMVSDPKRAREFYGKILGWSFDDESMPGYTLISTGHEPNGGIFQRPDGAPAACANMYFKVADIAATLTAAAEMGAKVLIPKTEIPGVGYFAMFADPEGIPIGVMQQSE
jgi:uncharacterized protein